MIFAVFLIIFIDPNKPRAMKMLYFSTFEVFSTNLLKLSSRVL